MKKHIEEFKQEAVRIALTSDIISVEPQRRCGGWPLGRRASGQRLTPHPPA
jgi:hypothetical protein